MIEVDKIWAPWLAARVSSACVKHVVDIDAALAGFELPVEGWHASIAEVMSVTASNYSEEWPTTDREMVTWLRMRPHLETVEDLRTAGIVLVRAVDQSVCLTLGDGRVAESWGGGLVINHFPKQGRYSDAYLLPYTVYMKGVRHAEV